MVLNRSPTYFKLAIGPSRNLNNHVQDGLLLIGIQRNIVEGRNRYSIFFNIDTVIQCICRSSLSHRVGCRGFGVVTFLTNRE